jgi:hypothetical protein
MDAQTGAPTVAASWISYGNGNAYGTGSHTGYSADFSPDNKYIYTSQIYPGAVTRYDIQSLNSTTIKSSQWIIGPMTTLTDSSSKYGSGGQIKRGPDGRMWMNDRGKSYQYNATNGTTQTCYISYISAPDYPVNSTAGIGLKLDAIPLATDSCGIWGLSQVATVFKPTFVVY